MANENHSVFLMIINNKKLSCRRETTRCIVFVCSQLQHAYSVVFLSPVTAASDLSSTVSQLFEPQVQKIAVFTYRSPHFCFPWRRPCDYHAICCTDGKTIRCSSNPSQHVPIYLQQFPSYTMLKSMRKSKNRYFYHIFVSPMGTPLGRSCQMYGWKENSMLTVRCLCVPTPRVHDMSCTVDCGYMTYGLLSDTEQADMQLPLQSFNHEFISRGV